MLKLERPRTRNVAARCAGMFGDLRLFISLCIAWLMVWRTLRRKRKESLVGIKRIRPIQTKTL